MWLNNERRVSVFRLHTVVKVLLDSAWNLAVQCYLYLSNYRGEVLPEAPLHILLVLWLKESFEVQNLNPDFRKISH